jgi:hypothetical protein
MWWPTEKADKVSRVDFATEFRDKHFVSVQLSAAVLLPRQNISPIAGIAPPQSPRISRSGRRLVIGIFSLTK